jgi:FixJ family two-component response regulator
MKVVSKTTSEPSRSSKLYIVDGDPSVNEILGGFGRSAGVAVDAYASGAEFLDRYEPERPACLVLDVTSPGGSNLGVLEVIRARRHPVGVVALGAGANVTVVVRALRAGAMSFIEKPLDGDELIATVVSALEHSANIFDRDCRRADFERRLACLTPRESEILSHLVVGKANKVVAYDLGISERTVEVHRYRLLRKMCVGSMVELARLAGSFDGLGTQLAGQGEHHVFLGRDQLAHRLEAVLA